MSFSISFNGRIFSWRVWLSCTLSFAGLVHSPRAMAADTVTATAPKTTIWTLDRLDEIAGRKPTLEGTPKLISDPRIGSAVQFAGKADGLVVAANPLAGLSQFTVEILFSPAADGLPEQRFFHVQDESGRRALIELRLSSDGLWWLDTFLKPAGASGLTLVDPKKTHRTGQWYWAAMRYDGKQMSNFVNGQKEIEGDVACEPMGAGQTSIGVRLNRVAWFKGAIREVRFHTEAVAPEKLQRVK